jgi:5-methylcytosine-specific restriction endonuclease McrA
MFHRRSQQHHPKTFPSTSGSPTLHKAGSRRRSRSIDNQKVEEHVPPTPNANQRGYSYEWQRYAAKYLKGHPYCVDPEKRHAGTRVLATVVDHKIPHKGNMALFWDVSNHQSLCTACHNHKTAVHDSKFASH